MWWLGEVKVGDQSVTVRGMESWNSGVENVVRGGSV